MAKRFTDTDKFKKPFIRNLPAAYKILWDYICLDCNFAGIWHKDFQIAQIYIGSDCPVTEEEALKHFNQGEERIIVLNHGSRWLVKPFLEFQYGSLNPANRVHASILERAEKEGVNLCPESKKKEAENRMIGFETFYSAYPKKKNKGDAEKAWKAIAPNAELLKKIILSLDSAKRSDGWKKEDGQFIPYPASWLRAKGWEDEHAPTERKQRDPRLLEAV